MNIWTLDIECYFKNIHGDADKYALGASPAPKEPKCGVTDYVTDKRWKMHGLGVYWPDGKATFERPDQIPRILSYIDKKDIVIAHNWAFDGFALSHHYGFRHWRVADTQLICNAVYGPKSASGVGNDVASVAKRLGLEEKGDLEPLNGVRDLTEYQWDYLAAYGKKDVRIERGIYDRVMPMLTRPEFELWIMRHCLNNFIHRPIVVNPGHVDEAKTAMAIRKRSVLDRVMITTDPCMPPRVEKEIQLSSDKQFSAILQPLLMANGMHLPMKISPTGNKIPALAKSDDGLKTMATCGVPEIEDLIAARLVKKSSATVNSRLKGLTGVTKAHLSITYHACSTGRPGGGGNGWNPLNIPAPHRAKTEEEADMARLTRRCLQAKPGMVFVAVDAANIEARMLAWMAGQWDLVEAFGQGIDYYAKFIGAMLNESVVKGRSKRDNALRDVGKEAILSLGYQAWADRFFRMLKENKSSKEIREALGNRFTLEFAKKVVLKYRDDFPHIKSLWSENEDKFHRARKGREGFTTAVGPMTYHSGGDGATVYMEYPCGRKTVYGNIRMIENKKGEKRWGYGGGKGIYGGLITENASQGNARDHVCECVFKAEMMGYPIVLSVYDSLVAEVEESRAGQCLADIIGLLSTSPTWAPETQLGAEGHISHDFN